MLFDRLGGCGFGEGMVEGMGKWEERERLEGEEKSVYKKRRGVKGKTKRRVI